ncbi:MAG: MFS transporter [Chloroflexi bacterium]|nr:MFS transporter [Chloroflexota bacterium]
MGNRWLMLAVIFTVRIVIGFQGQTLGSLAPLIVRDLGIDFTQLGTLLGLGNLPGLILAIPGAMLGRRFGDKQITLVSLGMMTAGGVLMGIGNDFGMLAIGRLISGAGSMLLSVLLTKMVIDWFSGREMVAAMALAMSSFPVGVSLGLVLLGPMATIMSWQMVMIMAAAMCAASLLFMLVAYRNPSASAMPATNPAARYRLGTRDLALIVLAGLIWALINVGYSTFSSFGPSYLTASGYSLADAGALISVAMWLTIPSVQLGGIVAQRIGHPNLVMLGSFLASGLLMLVIPPSLGQVAPLIAWGLIVGIPVGNIMALVPSVVQPHARSTAMGVFYTITYGLQAAVTPFSGMSRDVTRDPAAPIYFGAGAMFVCIAALILFRVLERKAASRSP